MAPEPRRRPQEVTFTLQRRVRETEDTSTLFLDRPESAPPYRAGQFLTLDPRQFSVVRPWLSYLEHAKGRKELVRAYSLSSAPDEPELAFTVKEEPYTAGVQPYPPLLSPFLVHGIPAGTRIKAVCFAGPYALPPDIQERTDHLVHIVAGSGAVPNFSILKDSLRHHPRLRHTFIYSNKTWQDVCFRDALAVLQAAHTDRLTVIHTLTRETARARFGPEIREGRITLDLLREQIPDPARPYIYVCGPAITPHARRQAMETGVSPTPRFLEQMLDFLERLGVDKRQIQREAYG